MSKVGSFGRSISACVFGAAGGIGGAFVDRLLSDPQVNTVHAIARNANSIAPRATLHEHTVDILDEHSLEKTARSIGPVDLVIVATGILHTATAQPEKTWRHLDANQMAEIFAVNTIGPSLVAKHFLPLLPREGKTVFAALSARVGSISDNRLGGWYAYRASKSALNMILKSASIELARTRKEALCIGLHPGTVDTELSRPFQANVAGDRLFAPARAADAMLDVIDGLESSQSGRVFAWDGTEVPA